MKTYNEMAHEALERISEQKNEQKKRRKIITGITSMAFIGHQLWMKRIVPMQNAWSLPMVRMALAVWLVIPAC